MLEQLLENKYPVFRYKWIYNQTLYLLLGIVIFFMTRQFPLDRFSILMNLSLLGVFGISLFHIYHTVRSSPAAVKTLLYCMLNIISIYFLISITVYQHPVTLAFRFALILFLITLAYFIRPPSKYLPVFNVIVLIEAFFVILMEVGMVTFFNLNTYLPVRFFFLNNGWGDVFTFNGWFYYIEVGGTAILPFAYMFSYIDPGKKYLRFRRIILLLSVIFAGNFAYLIGIAFFHVFWFFRSRSIGNFRAKVLKGILLTFIVALPSFNFVFHTLDRKSGTSLGTRYDQTEVLMRDLGSSVSSILFGRGLGNQVNVQTEFRDYEHYVYYELQSLYFLNQMGVIFFLLFIGYNIILTFYNYNQNRWIILVYASYIVYAATNPYFLDTTQIMVILTLNTLVDFNKRGL